MVSGKHRSRTYRRVFKRVPGGRTVRQFLKRKPSAHKCGGCNTKLSGMLRERPYKVKKQPKTARRPERPYGGNLCSSCTKRIIINQTRQ